MEGVRLAVHDDLADLARLVGEAVAELTPQRGGEMWARTSGRRPPFEPELIAALDDPDVLVLAGTVDDALVGYSVARLQPIDGGDTIVVIDDLFTEPGARAVGVGEAMLGVIIEWGSEKGAVGIDAVVLPGARETKNFFESFGLKARALVVHRDLP
jgi:GNAT superfamily N-acetyltransferase